MWEAVINLREWHIPAFSLLRDYCGVHTDVCMNRFTARICIAFTLHLVWSFCSWQKLKGKFLATIFAGPIDAEKSNSSLYLKREVYCDNPPFTFTQPETKFKLQQLNIMTYLFSLWLFPLGYHNCWCLVCVLLKYKLGKAMRFLMIPRAKASLLLWCGVKH